jgi:hypothetical protein
MTRPDIYYAVNYLSKFNTKFTDKCVPGVKHVLGYLQSTKDYGLVLKSPRAIDQTTIHAYIPCFYLTCMQYIFRESIEVIFCPTMEMIADVFTKALSGEVSSSTDQRWLTLSREVLKVIVLKGCQV